MKLITDIKFRCLGLFDRERVMAVKCKANANMAAARPSVLHSCNLQEVKNQKVILASQRGRSLQMHGGSSSVTFHFKHFWPAWLTNNTTSGPPFPKGSSSRPGSRMGLLTGRTIVILTGFLLNSTLLGAYQSSGSLGRSAASTIIRCSRSGWQRVFRPPPH